jgi:hypothetical protein
MADLNDLKDLAKDGLIVRKSKRYRELLDEIEGLCKTVQLATLMLMPGNLNDLKIGQAEQAILKLKMLVPEALKLKAELEKEGVCPLF